MRNFLVLLVEDSIQFPFEDFLSIILKHPNVEQFIGDGNSVYKFDEDYGCYNCIPDDTLREMYTSEV